MNQKFKLLYCDPPWNYNNKVSNGAAASHYDLLSMGELLLLEPQLNELMDPDSVIAMWAVSPMLPEALNLMDHFHYQYKTVLFNWMKRTVNGKLAFGPGNYTRAGSELCLLGVKGKGLKRANASVRQVFEGPLREHSRKPDQIRDRLVELFGDVPRVELFARSEHPGWVSMGNEKSKFSKPVEPDLSFLD